MRLILILLLSFVLSETRTNSLDALLNNNFNMDPWGGYSVATSDNLDAFTYNPAGFAINHGQQTGYYWLANNNTLDDNSPFFYGFKVHGFGYSFQFNKGDKLFNATDVKISFAGKFNRNLSLGAQWSKYNKNITMGVLIRPLNYLSLGLVSTFDEDLKELNSTRIGLALRPFRDDKITLGMDVLNQMQREIEESEDVALTWITSYSPFLELCLGGAFSIRSQFFLESLDDVDMENMSSVISMNVNFGKSGFYVNQNQQVSGGHNIYENWGIGFQKTSQRKTTIINTPKKNEKRYVRLDLNGLFIEEKPAGTPFNPLALLFTNPEKGKQLKAWIDEIDRFAEDSSVEGLIIDLGSVRAGYSKKQEIYNTLTNFKKTGKKIIIYAKNGISNTDYYLISMADEIYINQMTGIDLKGLSMEVTFIRQLLDTLNIVPEVFRVNIDGDSYKTAGDPFLERTATDEMKENYGELLKDLYDIFVKGIARGRDWNEDKTREIIDAGPYYIESEILEKELVTEIIYPDQFEDYVEELTSNDKTNKISHEIIKWDDIDRSDEYIVEWKPAKKHNIALIYAVGGIMSGESKSGPSGSTIMGDKTIIKAIKSAREDKNIEAIVLRIDSGGGSALASDQMWREIELTTNNEDSLKNKPFIASMSSVAASGGYYIACQADKIMANESTITGSIGVIGLNLNTSKFWRQFGINIEVIVKEGEHADFYTNTRLRSDYETKKIEDSIDDIYNTFKQRVIDGREGLDDINELDNIAMGRVWSGNKAKGNLLIDETGGINDAIMLAANNAGIEDTENINIIEYPKRDIAEKIRKLIDVSISKKAALLDYLPDELKTEYHELINLGRMSEDGAIIIIPHTIEIK